MKRDIILPDAKDIAIAIVPAAGNEKDHWQVFFINLNPVPVDTVLIQAQGMTTGKESNEKTTAPVRFMLPALPALSARQFEVLVSESLTTSHRYWVSYYIGSLLYEKKIMVTQQELEKGKLHILPVLEKEGMLFQ
ncbi:MAG: hypothetical protein IT223_01205 [Crocinitomicaceae bacterium]|nr:hypothetical protein [Crocinitomicaceae bacterium]